MKRFITAVLAAAMALTLFVPSFASAAENDNILRIYSWEDYIATDEEDENITMANQFETWYEETYGVDITVEYSTFGTNEIMYNQLKINPGYYDLVCPSDYMIQKMIEENMAEEFSADFLNPDYPGSEPDASVKKLPSHYTKYVSSYIHDLFGSYAVGSGKTWNNYAAGYMWGTMGFVYNPDNVASSDMNSWGSLWNVTYKNQSTLKDSVRDTYLVGLAFVYRDELMSLRTQYMSGDIQADEYNKKINEILNRTDDDTLALVEQALSTVKGNIFGFEVDSGKNDMVTGTININVAWSGDAVYAMDEAEEQGVELNYTVPTEGSNIWFDGWVMPTGANTELAEAFINYISMPVNACANMDYIGYTSVIAGDEVFDRMVETYGLETSATEGYTAVDLSYFFTELTGGRSAVVYTDTVGRQFSAQYPDEETVNRCAIMNYFDDETNDKVNIIWENIRGNSLPVWVFIVIGVVVVGIVAFFVVRYVLKNRRGGRRPKKGYKVISKG